MVGSHDTRARTIQLEHNADSISCSHDDGDNWGSCDSADSVVFTIADYNNASTLHVKFTKTGVDDVIYSLTPSAELPNLIFVNCTATISANGAIADFIANYSSVASQNSVICINSGVTLSHSSPTDGGSPSIVLGASGASGAKIVGTLDNSPVISMNPGNAYTLFDIQGAGIELINLKMNDMWTDQAGAKFIAVGASPASVTLRNVSISGSTLNGYAVYSVSGGSVSVIGSRLQDVSYQIRFTGIYASGSGTVTVQDFLFADGVRHLSLTDGVTSVVTGSKFFAPNNYFSLILASSSTQVPQQPSR